MTKEQINVTHNRMCVLTLGQLSRVSSDPRQDSWPDVFPRNPGNAKGTHLNCTEQHCTQGEGHQGCPEDPKDEPGSHIQEQDVEQVEQEEEVVGLQEAHSLHGGPQLPELIS